MSYHVVYITAADEAEARIIGRVLVEEKLVACVNFYPIQSIYHWDEKMEESSEMAVLAKTSSGLVDRVIDRVKGLHSYEVPCIVSWPIERGNPDYLKWIDESTDEE